MSCVGINWNKGPVTSTDPCPRNAVATGAKRCDECRKGYHTMRQHYYRKRKEAAVSICSQADCVHQGKPVKLLVNRTVCSQCAAKVGKQWRSTANGKASAQKDLAKNREKNRLKLITTCREPGCKDPNKIQKVNVYYRCKDCVKRGKTERVNRRVAKWKKNNPEAYKAHAAAAQHRRRGVPGTWTVSQWIEAMKHFGSNCLCCGVKYDRSSRATTLSIDHVFPVNWWWNKGDKRATNYLTNLQPLCFTCNRKKWKNDCTDYRTDEQRAMLAALMENSRYV